MAAPMAQSHSTSQTSSSCCTALCRNILLSLWVCAYTPEDYIIWNIIMEVWKIIFLSKWMICRFHVNLPGCKVCMQVLTKLIGWCIQDIWTYWHPRAIPDANIINKKSRNTTELKKLLYTVKYWSLNACIVLHYPMLCIPGNSWQKIIIMPRSTKIAKASGNHSCIDTFCMLIWCTSPTDENQQTNPLRTVQVLSNSWMCLLWWWKQFRTSSRNSDFSGDLPWYLNKP